MCILSRTVSKLLQIIGQIFTFYGYTSLLIRGEPLKSRYKSWPQEINIDLSYRFHILNCLHVDHECDGQTDGQTESSLTTARSDIVKRLLQLTQN